MDTVKSPSIVFLHYQIMSSDIIHHSQILSSRSIDPSILTEGQKIIFDVVKEIVDDYFYDVPIKNRSKRIIDPRLYIKVQLNLNKRLEGNFESVERPTVIDLDFLVFYQEKIVKLIDKKMSRSLLTGEYVFPGIGFFAFSVTFLISSPDPLRIFGVISTFSALIGKFLLDKTKIDDEDRLVYAETFLDILNKLKLK